MNRADYVGITNTLQVTLNNNAQHYITTLLLCTLMTDFIIDLYPLS